MEINNCINFILSNAQNAVYNYFKKRLSDYDVTPSQYALLQWHPGAAGEEGPH